MTAPPLPASPCVRVKLDYTSDYGNELGSRFYLSYAGSAPTAANCATLASDIAAAWNTNLASVVNQAYALAEVDVLDIATDSGASGNWTGTHTGGDTGTENVAQAATNVEFDISRRYRGGKPRMFLPPAGVSSTANSDRWSTDFIAAVNSGMAAFFAEIEALTIGAVGALAHVNLSYYKGFTNIMNSSGRERAVPTYRATALLDTVTGYSCKAVIGSQRRRRTSTTY